MGSNDTGSTSRPLNAKERGDIFNTANRLLSTDLQTADVMDYNDWVRQNGSKGWFDDDGGKARMESEYQKYVDNANKQVDQANTLKKEFKKMSTYESPEFKGSQDYFNFANQAQAGDFNGADYVDSRFRDAGQTRSAGEARTLTGGDYDKLEQNLIQSRLAPLMRQKEIDAKNVDAQLAKRGLYSSGIAIDAQNDLNERYIPQINAAASEASAQRYGLQSGENQGVNQFVLSNTGMLNEGDFQRAQSENQFNQTNDQQENAFNLNQSAAENAWRRANATDTNQFNLQKAAGQTQTSQAQAGAENTFNTDQAEKQYNAKWRPLDYLQGVWNGTGGSISSSTGGGWSV